MTMRPRFLQPAALGVHLRDGEAGVVVYADVRAAQDARGGADALPLVVREAAGLELFAVHKALAGEQAHDELLPRHLQREHGDRPARGLGRGQGDVQADAGLAHAGPGGDEYEVARSHAEDGAVQLAHTCRRCRACCCRSSRPPRCRRRPSARRWRRAPARR